MLEQVLERMLTEMIRANEINERFAAALEWQQARLAKRDAEEAAGGGTGTTKPEPVKPEPAKPTPEPAKPTIDPADRKALLEECARIGIEVKPRTKTETLARMVADAAEPSAPGGDVSAALADKVREVVSRRASETPAPPAGPAAPAAPAPLSVEELRALIASAYDNSDRHKSLLVKALASAGATCVSDVPEDLRRQVADGFLQSVKEI